ncbi:acetyl-coenzyme-A carboxylase, partial [Quaeritorhiza haematococci]
IPRIYISANSGARIGLAEEVSKRFKVAWVDESNPSKGLKYLYLDEESYKLLVLDKLVSTSSSSSSTKSNTSTTANTNTATAKSANTPSKPGNADSKTKGDDAQQPSCVCTRIVDEETGDVRYKIEYIVGQVDGLGVENLSGSGMIAGETSKAYDEIFTITLVTCRSVGIGAYLVRLGQRVVQVEYTPIILTGAAALNKVLGREVYTSNLQLGGTQIMFKNGVSHHVAQNDMEGVVQILHWLSYVPKAVGTPLPVLPPPEDNIEREVEVELPSGGGYDPRRLLAGYENENGEWVAGFFDKDSFTESMAGWAKGVVVGRARLGGIPMGVIAVETRSTETVLYADPADEASTETTVQEAGQVWYPNSSFKTAQAIRDFNKGEQLPLIIFANWRGFSGGQSDMYKEVLKYGAYIVDALVDYRQPVFVYLIGELRGGAWVVLDPKINPQMMEMYAESNARGGVLEPEGIVEIKFRKPQLLATMERLDSKYRNLKRRLNDPATPPEEKSALQKEFEKREKLLLPLYHQAAVLFADLHDRPGRMVAKGVINDIVDWRRARRFFYWRLLRRISEEDVLREVFKADPKMKRDEARALMSRWFAEDNRNKRVVVDAVSGSVVGRWMGSSSLSTFSLSEKDLLTDYNSSDLDVVRWLEEMRESVEERIAKMRSEAKVRQVAEIAKEDPKAAVEGLVSALKGLEGSQRKAVLDALAKLDQL